MKAVRFHECGGPEVLRVDEVPRPEPGPGEVVVALAAAGVNFIDVYLRTGYYDPGPLPAIAGKEGAGVVEAVGEGVLELRVGDRVAFSDAPGAYAEAVKVRAGRAIPVPDGFDLETAAALPLQGMTAHYLTHTIRPLEEGDRVLIHAAAGGVGLLAVQARTPDGSSANASAPGSSSTAASGSKDWASRPGRCRTGSGSPAEGSRPIVVSVP